MTGTILRLAAVLFILVVALLSVTRTAKNPSDALANSAPSAPRSETPVIWEYRTVNAGSQQLIVDNANQLGGESWELVSIAQVENDNRYKWVAFFKRKKQIAPGN
jgi:hypothetical protein